MIYITQVWFFKRLPFANFIDFFFLGGLII
jgi:hypothetical protein